MLEEILLSLYSVHFNPWILEHWKIVLSISTYIKHTALCLNASCRLFLISYLSYQLHCCALPDKRCLSHGMLPLSGHDDVALFKWRRWWRGINIQIENYVIIASLKSETMGKLINRIPGSRLLISSLPGSALRTLVESLGKPRDVNMRSQSLAW